MYLNQIVNSAKSKIPKINVKGICFDSRKIKNKDVFFAINGKNTSGINYLDQVIKKGAVAIIAEDKIKFFNYKVPIIYVKNIRKSLSRACSNFYKKKPRNIIAVTGTNGKTSVVSFFNQILNHNKINSASIGTLGINSKKIKIKTKLTSMDPIFLHKNLKILKEKNIEIVILEASSHGLDQNRLDYIKFKTGIFTNLSHEHLDYHKNFKNYLNSKMYLFKKLLNKKSNIITDSGNKEYKILKKISLTKKIKINTIGIKKNDLKVLNYEFLDQAQLLKILYNKKIYKVKVPLIGSLQIKNIMMSVLAAKSVGIKFKNIMNSLEKLKPVDGRLEFVGAQRNNSKIIIDFAHTPHALEQTLLTIKDHFQNNISLVFGCGGERDIKKRSIMGKIAKKYCKKIYITDDNPRTEDAKIIRSMIISENKKIFKEIPSRKEAIDFAIKNLEQNEVLLVAGKGHEKFQDYGSYKVKFSDKDTIKNSILKNKKYFRNYNWKFNILKKTIKKNSFKKFTYKNLSIDSSNVTKGDIFLAIKGKNKDGHNYVKDALKNGASKVIVSKKLNIIKKKQQIKIHNSMSFLNKISKNTRFYSSAKIIAITGSAGKTSLKNLVSFTLKKYGNVYSSPKSFNNHYGVPLSLSNLKEKTKFGVFEIGMSKKGEISTLSNMVKPNVAVITNISAAHVENFKNLKDIAKEKSEIINNVSNFGHIILNKDDKFYKYLYKIAKLKKLNILSFSAQKKADIYLKKIIRKKNIYNLIIVVNNKTYNINSKFNFQNYIENILSTISVLYALNLDIKKIGPIFKKFIFPPGRGDISTIKIYGKKIKFIDESYNANPISMKFAINTLNNYRNLRGKKILILGDMLELGKYSIRYHQKLSTEINKTNINKVYVCGEYVSKTFNGIKNSKKGEILKKPEYLQRILKKYINNNDTLMIKGSNATGLFKISQNLKKGKINAL